MPTRSRVRSMRTDKRYAWRLRIRMKLWLRHFGTTMNLQWYFGTLWGCDTLPILWHTLGLHTLAAILWRYFGAAMNFWLRYWGCNDTLAHVGAAMILGPYIASAEDSVLTCSPTHTRCVRHDCSDQTSSHHTLYVSIPKLLDALFVTLRLLATPTF